MASTTPSPQILIVGAGPVGLTTALALHQAGVPADALLVADRRQRPPHADHPEQASTWSRALSMSAGSLEVLRALGVADRFVAAGVPVARAHFGGGPRLLDLDRAVLGTRHPFNLALPQARTEALLLRRCEEVGVPFAWGREFRSLRQLDQQQQSAGGPVVSVTLSRPRRQHVGDSTGQREAEGEGEGEGEGEEAEVEETIEPAWVVGCDGTHSAVRQAAGVAWAGTKATRFTWAADCAVRPEPPLERLQTGRDGGGRAMAYVLGGSQVRFIGNISPAEVADAGGGRRLKAPDLDYVRRWAARTFGGRFSAAEGGILETEAEGRTSETKEAGAVDNQEDHEIQSLLWATVTGDGMSLASTFRAGRVFLAGDAAHALFPAGAQGMNTGLLDAANLAWKLALALDLLTPHHGGGDDGAGAGAGVVQVAHLERVLDSYTAERRPAVEAVVRNVQVQAASLFGTTDRERAVSDFMAEALDQPALNRRWARRVTGFGDPTAPYRLAGLAGSLPPGDGGGGGGEENELVGTRLTHVADAHEEALLQAARHNTFLLARLEQQTGGDMSSQWTQLTTAVTRRYPGRVTVLDELVKAEHEKWKDVHTFLIRPDLRVAWVSREGDDSHARIEDTLIQTLSWWLGDRE